MADRIEHYRGYEIAFYQRGTKVLVQIRENNSLPPIVDMPTEVSYKAAKDKAYELINQKLANAAK